MLLSRLIPRFCPGVRLEEVRKIMITLSSVIISVSLMRFEYKPRALLLHSVFIVYGIILRETHQPFDGRS
jgi:hypothetical protein